MGVPAHNLNDLEERRLALEDNILQLQKSLYHWRTLEADYDGLRDGIKGLEGDATTDDFLLVSREFGSAQVKEEDMKRILDAKGTTRSRDQVVDILGRRIDYVKENSSVMEKRLRAAEDELYSLDAGDQPPVQGGPDFAMREIMEELDEDGTIVSSSVNAPGDDAPQLLDLLKKAGVENIPEIAKARETAANGTSAPVEAQSESTQQSQPVENNFTTDAGPAAVPDAHESPQEEADEELDLSRPVSLVTDEDRSVPAVTNVDESLEDAQLRREMLQYGIDEVGAIVAELEMDEDGSEFSVEDEDFEFGSDDEEEDEFGRSRTELSEDYHQQMRDLQSKLNAHGMWNLGKDTQSFPEDVEIQEPEPAEDTHANGDSNTSQKSKKSKKRVAFADDLDIAPAPSGPSAEELPTREKRTLPPMPEAPPLADAIVERTEQTSESKPGSTEVPKRVSRFKSARSAAQPLPQPPTASPQISDPVGSQTTRKQANAVPTAVPPTLFPATPQEPKPFSTPIADNADTSSAHQPPQGKTLADTLVERDIARGTAHAPEPDELDEEIHRREIASEFYKMRNRQIQNNGGFINDDEPEGVPLNVEEPPKRISKFKAARMK